MRVGNNRFVGVFSCAGRPASEAEPSLCLFARDVLPALQRLEQSPA